MSRYRLHPAPDQVPMLAEHCQQARALWNVCVEQQSYYVRGGTRPPGRAERYRQLTEARAESDWLRKGSVTVQQQALRDFDQALANFFRGTHRKPRFRKRGLSESFRVVGKDARVEKLNRKWSRCWVPKLGWVRFRRTRDLPPGVRSYRIIMDRAGRWHVAFAARPDPVDGPGTGEIVGVDRGVAVTAALSTGEMLRCPGLTVRERARLRKAQRRAARAAKKSPAQESEWAKIGRLRAREADRRKDFVEKASTRLARGFDLIRFEKLNIVTMTRSAAGKVDAPGRGVRQKAGLNRSILAQGWGMLRARTGDKAPGRVQDVRAPYTSLRCSACGWIEKKSRESQAVFRCVACGFTCNADVNAAVNVAAGQPVTRRAGRAGTPGRAGGTTTGNRPSVREPQRKTPARMVGVE
jgi:transposase